LDGTGQANPPSEVSPELEPTGPRNDPQGLFDKFELFL
jgi:hypothetical protein